MNLRVYVRGQFWVVKGADPITDVLGGAANESEDFIGFRGTTLGLGTEGTDANPQLAYAEWIIASSLMLTHDIAEDPA